jgi:Outer membrane protein beta-barrel domain
MKRILITLSAVALIATAATANAAGMYAGIKAGANFANMSNSEDFFEALGGANASTSMRTGFQGGLFVGKDVNPQFGFRVEGLWVQKGVKADVTVATPGGDVTAESTLKLDYIEFPILFVYNLSNSETMGFNIFAGPTLGFNISANASADGGDDEDIKDGIESFEFGAAIGAGLAKKMANGKAIGLDARYTIGATGVGKDVPDGFDNPKNRGIGLMAYYQIPIGGSAQ